MSLQIEHHSDDGKHRVYGCIAGIALAPVATWLVTISRRDVWNGIVVTVWPGTPVLNGWQVLILSYVVSVLFRGGFWKDKIDDRKPNNAWAVGMTVAAMITYGVSRLLLWGWGIA